MVEQKSKLSEFLDFHKLCFVATVSPEGKPNISPKGTLFAYHDFLVFANIRSPDTIRNILHNPAVEINTIDPLTRKGFLIKGKGEIFQEGDFFNEVLDLYKKNGIQSKISSIVKIIPVEIMEVTSPLYDLGYTEENIKMKWKNHYLG